MDQYQQIPFNQALIFHDGERAAPDSSMSLAQAFPNPLQMHQGWGEIQDSPSSYLGARR